MLGLTVEEKQKALVYASGGADFMFIPSYNLCNMIAAGSFETIELNKTLAAILLMRNPVRLDAAMVIKYCRGSLDNKNTWLFDHGDIKVVPHQYKKPELLKSKKS